MKKFQTNKKKSLFLAWKLYFFCFILIQPCKEKLLSNHINDVKNVCLLMKSRLHVLENFHLDRIFKQINDITTIFCVNTFTFPIIKYIIYKFWLIRYVQNQVVDWLFCVCVCVYQPTHCIDHYYYDLFLLRCGFCVIINFCELSCKQTLWKGNFIGKWSENCSFFFLN